MTELPENVTEALAPQTFDILEFVAGQGTPRDTVTIYTDSNAAFRLAELAEMEASNTKRAETEGLGITDELEWVDPDEVEALQTAILETALIFELKGLAPAAKKALRLGLVAKHNFKESEPAETQEAFFEDYTFTLIAKTISGVKRADGSVDPAPWTPERVGQLRDILFEGEFTRLDTAVYEINFKTDIYDRAVSADFLSKR